MQGHLFEIHNQQKQFDLQKYYRKFFWYVARETHFTCGIKTFEHFKKCMRILTRSCKLCRLNVRFKKSHEQS